MKNYEGYDGKIAVVTGGASGIGKQICLNLAEQGATVIVADINFPGAEETVKLIKEAKGEGFAIDIDITDLKSVETGFATVIEKYKTVDILVNNASKPSTPSLPNIFSKDISEWDEIFQIDLRGLVYCIKQIYELFKEKKSGKIINIASIAGRMATPTVPVYGSLKAGVVQFTKTLAKDLAAFNINVNCICPGFLFTPMWQQSGTLIANSYPEESRPTAYEVFTNMIQGIVPMKREQTVEDIANAVAFLCSEYAKNITGQTINIDGGTLMN
jgi:NAD(P)-dependent dehydrogenase (short-subunit alcohol dehydrogenase family)